LNQLFERDIDDDIPLKRANFSKAFGKDPRKLSKKYETDANSEVSSAWAKVKKKVEKLKTKPRIKDDKDLKPLRPIKDMSIIKKVKTKMRKMKFQTFKLSEENSTDDMNHMIHHQNSLFDTIGYVTYHM